MDIEKAIEFLKVMGYSESDAREMLASPGANFYLRQLESVEDGIKMVMNNQDVDAVSLLREANNNPDMDASSLSTGRRRR